MLLSPSEFINHRSDRHKSPDKEPLFDKELCLNVLLSLTDYIFDEGILVLHWRYCILGVSTSDILAITTERGCLWVSQCLWFMILIVLKFCLGEEKNIFFYYSTLSCSCLKFWGTLQMPCCLHKYFPGPLSPGPLHKLYLQHYCLNLAIWTVDAIISLPDEGNLAQTINIIQG